MGTDIGRSKSTSQWSDIGDPVESTAALPRYNTVLWGKCLKSQYEVVARTLSSIFPLRGSQRRLEGSPD